MFLGASLLRRLLDVEYPSRAAPSLALREKVLPCFALRRDRPEVIQCDMTDGFALLQSCAEETRRLREEAT